MLVVWVLHIAFNWKSGNQFNMRCMNNTYHINSNVIQGDYLWFICTFMKSYIVLYIAHIWVCVVLYHCVQTIFKWYIVCSLYIPNCFWQCHYSHFDSIAISFRNLHIYNAFKHYDYYSIKRKKKPIFHINQNAKTLKILLNQNIHHGEKFTALVSVPL